MALPIKSVKMGIDLKGPQISRYLKPQSYPI